MPTARLPPLLLLSVGGDEEGEEGEGKGEEAEGEGIGEREGEGEGIVEGEGGGGDTGGLLGMMGSGSRGEGDSKAGGGEGDRPESPVQTAEIVKPGVTSLEPCTKM